MRDININDYDYDLPAERIAQYPVSERDKSQLLVYRGHLISKDVFKNIDIHLPPDSLLVFNNTRVIRARILFNKETGAVIEVLCLEPFYPVDYVSSFSSKGSVEWKCIVGNLKKWKKGTISTTFRYKDIQYDLLAECIQTEGDTCRIKFSWNSKSISFGEVIEATGHIPLPPYINRGDEKEDIERYQTVYSSIKGSIAAPTAGLHFTEDVLAKIKARGIHTAELTLHVGAGTFQPVKTANISGHAMHSEHFSIDADSIELLIASQGKIIPVGTTSVRTIESLYWFGVKMIENLYEGAAYPELRQWEPYEIKTEVSVTESLKAILNYLKIRNLRRFSGSTSILIVPGYKFKLTDGMITNFHQPRSTLLLLISAWTGERWKEIYKFALENGFRFLSYGDSSVLLK